MKKFLRYFLCTAAVSASAAFFCSCSDEPPKELPLARSQLVNEIFRMMSAREYREVLPKIERYKAMDETNVFVTRLEALAMTNAYVAETRALMNAGDWDGALKHIDEGLVKCGELDNLVAVKKQVAYVVEMNSLVDKLNGPLSASDMNRTANDLLAKSRKDKNASAITAFANAKIGEAAILKDQEYDRACFGILSDALAHAGTSDGVAPISAAIIENERNSRLPLTLLEGTGAFD